MSVRPDRLPDQQPQLTTALLDRGELAAFVQPLAECVANYQTAALVAGEALECLPDRSPTNAESLLQVVLTDDVAGREIDPDDEVADGAIGPLAQ